MSQQKTEEVIDLTTLQKTRRTDRCSGRRRDNNQRDLLECLLILIQIQRKRQLNNEIEIDSTVWKTVTRNRRCSNSKCDIAYEDNIFVPAGEWVIDTTPEPWELQTCPKCGNKFTVKFTTSDTKFYPSNPAPPERKQGKYKHMLLEGRPCPDTNRKRLTCVPFKEEMEFKAVNLEAGEKDWEPKSHNQTCHACGKEYYLDWTITERNYF